MNGTILGGNGVSSAVLVIVGRSRRGGGGRRVAYLKLCVRLENTVGMRAEEKAGREGRRGRMLGLWLVCGVIGLSGIHVGVVGMFSFYRRNAASCRLCSTV